MHVIPNNQWILATAYKCPVTVRPWWYSLKFIPTPLCDCAY